MESNVEKKTVDVNGSLIRKTKAQLVEIILRKDEVEHNLRKTIEDNKKQLNIVYKDINDIDFKFKAINQKYSNLKSDYDNINNRYYAQISKLSSSRDKWRYISLFLMLVTVFSFIF